ncbi:MAG: hypothetical protein OSJ70_07195 [Bacilli bacterium]|nr:hypothetical protein [Bacilli bacterium]
MVEYCASSSYFAKLQLLSSEGRESNVYLDPDAYDIPTCVKEYSNSFWLDCSNDEAIKKMFSLDEKLKDSKNISPSIIFYDIDEYKKGNKKLVAIGLPYLQDYISIDKVTDISNKFLCFKNLVALLIDFASSGIYPTDLNSSNIMVSPEFNIQLIDLDGNHCKVDPDNPSYYYNQIFNSIRYRIITELLLNEEEYLAAYKYSSLKEGERTILKQKGYSSNIIDILLEDREDQSLDDLLESLKELEPLFVEGQYKK